MGIPCVSIDNGGAGEVLVPEQTGFLVPLNNEELFAMRVMQLIDDNALRARMGRAARLRVEVQFALELVVDQLVRIYSRGVPEETELPTN